MKNSFYIIEPITVSTPDYRFPIQDDYRTRRSEELQPGVQGLHKEAGFKKKELELGFRPKPAPFFPCPNHRQNERVGFYLTKQTEADEGGGRGGNGICIRGAPTKCLPSVFSFQLEFVVFLHILSSSPSSSISLIPKRKLIKRKKGNLLRLARSRLIR